MRIPLAERATPEEKLRRAAKVFICANCARVRRTPAEIEQDLGDEFMNWNDG
ncbi:MAG: hypothetical protein ABSH25_12280 [Syntrophorhabdales bacterium]